jgi:hypothetical protein
LMKAWRFLGLDLYIIQNGDPVSTCKMLVWPVLRQLFDI